MASGTRMFSPILRACTRRRRPAAGTVLPPLPSSRRTGTFSSKRRLPSPATCAPPNSRGRPLG